METGNNLNIIRVKNVDEKLISDINVFRDKDKYWNTEQGNKFIADDDSALFIAYLNDECAGLVSAYRLQRFDEKRAEILLYEIDVLEKFQQKGIGKALVERVKEWGRETGAFEVWVLTYSSNIPAMALYTSTGGVEDEPGTRMFTYVL